MSDINDRRTVRPLNIDRALFLKVRCAYLRTMLARGETYSEAVDAINIHDYQQAQLIGMTHPNFGDGTVTRELLAIVATLSDEDMGKVAKAVTLSKPRRKARR